MGQGALSPLGQFFQNVSFPHTTAFRKITVLLFWPPNLKTFRRRCLIYIYIIPKTYPLPPKFKPECLSQDKLKCRKTFSFSSSVGHLSFNFATKQNVDQLKYQLISLSILYTRRVTSIPSSPWTTKLSQKGVNGSRVLCRVVLLSRKKKYIWLYITKKWKLTILGGKGVVRSAA